ncbi:monovalent cation/H(+) antiporter subunit G [Haloarcula onubensis]|uniref:Monovalent cation/H(+) antiporter subunit G n=1 Tax=Haloarcula onubensis TaxID=2950539 RepID=A0ABU2FLC6_9EURY|nr:monovalent cation/H(+) antiporter subunit G [Halomicroarcula sp. S3CR25-11]MDS0281540.1 monovalent cation/H(+) antiporter subunit G [Halomicroarcula sp. S3CR25-11]
MIATVQAAVVTALIVVGSFFLLVGTIGLLRLPNVYNRMHATSKATTLGASSMLLAATVYYGPVSGGLTALVCIVFLFFTAPTGAHVISRAAQKMGVPFTDSARWPKGEDETPADDD